MKDIDKLIRETLTEEEAKFYNDLEEQHLFGKVKSLYKGKNAWLTVVMHVMNIIVFGLMIYCLIQTFDVEETNDLLLWVSGFFFCFITMSMLKLYSWMAMDKNTILREMKRLELQVSSLSAKISE
ncbi:MAG: DUF6768 family protein [Psychroserpens sp.]|uniref:DUF6768 family protein n=1 Tax=Psychroserpens sp. TaxID=2020870 RepID=UPI003C99747C